MPTVNIQEVQTQLGHFVAEAEAGQEIIISRGGKPVARLVGLVQPTHAPRQLGLGKSEFAFPENFDHLYADEIADLFQSGD